MLASNIAVVRHGGQGSLRAYLYFQKWFLAASVNKSALLSDGGSIPRTMKNPDDDKCSLGDLVVNGIRMVKRHPQARAELVAGRANQWRVACHIYCLGNPVKVTGCSRFTRFGRNVSPDFRKVGFRCIGEVKGQGLADNFLPLAMMRFLSNLRTRPAAISANPLSISAFSAANS